jgi:hypothetical protein
MVGTGVITGVIRRLRQKAKRLLFSGGVRLADGRFLALLNSLPGFLPGSGFVFFVVGPIVVRFKEELRSVVEL